MTMDLAELRNLAEQRRFRKALLLAKGSDNVTSGYSLFSMKKEESFLRRQQRSLNNIFRGTTVEEMQRNRDVIVQNLQKSIFQNQAMSSADYKYDPSRSRQINQTRNFTSKAPVY